ncbi:hypothetical protein FE257_008275 [Aspergillus nanangensis]|uniref:Uncharacterized protein n=1 Tax=Aspergillus nanangensis TaxID=2582783 RepID=A0AAD4CLU3_ASPNN|nr:hypothetical protein FE257_008275 [Aspergillus nanangensis]
MTQLHNDMNLWLVDGNRQVQLDFILNWKLHNGNCHASGSVEVYGLDPNGMPVRQGQPQIIFPTPANGQNQVIGITRRQLFAGNPALDSNIDDIFVYDLDTLRDLATISLAFMSLLLG